MQGERFLTRFSDRTFTRLALIGAALAALTLAGCGRKGPLDPPPGAQVAEPVAAAPVTPEPLVAVPGQPTDSSVNRSVAPVGPNKRIFLDGLLN